LSQWREEPHSNIEIRNNWPISNFDFRKSSLRVAGVMFLDAFWEQPFAAALPSPCERCTTSFGPHPRTKAVLTFACSLGWLVSAFHNTEREPDTIWERLQ
jgi:hypothetical protein